jgi:GNAT superfamily N-acetyltransferase
VEDAAAVFQLLTEEMSTIQQHLLLSAVKTAIGSDQPERVAMTAAVAEGRPVAAAAAVPMGETAGNLVGYAAVSGTPPTALDAALARLHAHLAARGMRFIQSMHDPQAACEPLRRSGYQRIAILDYLSAPVPKEGVSPNGLAASRQAAAPLRFAPGCADRGAAPTEGLDPAWVSLVEATYAGSLDCPAIEAQRSAADTLASYRAAPHFDPQLWIAAYCGQEPVGCLLLAAHASVQVLEVVYMGLVPSVRRRGWGSELIEETWRVARRMGMETVTLAVDQQNDPARRLYRGWGFERLMSETVWSRTFAPEESRGFPPGDPGRETAWPPKG